MKAQKTQKVLHAIWSISPSAGGPAQALKGLAAAQVRAGLEVAILATYRHGEDLSAKSEFEACGARVILVGPCYGPLMRHPSLSEEMAKGIRASTVVHIHGVWEEVNHQAARWARRAGVPYVIRPCGMLDPWSLSQSRWKKRLHLLWRSRSDLSHAGALHFTSSTESERTALMGLSARAIVEPNGVDLSEFEHTEPGRFRPRWPTVGQRPLVLFLSRLHPKKGLEILIPAWAQVLQGMGDLADGPVLVIAGPDENGERARIEEMVESRSLSASVVFTGPLFGAERAAALRDADLFVLPSYQENFGVAVVESLAAGTPVVISDQVNIHKEISACGIGGVSSTSVPALSREIKRWLQDDRLRLEAASRSRKFVRARYDWDTLAARWVGHYTELGGG